MYDLLGAIVLLFCIEKEHTYTYLVHTCIHISLHIMLHYYITILTISTINHVHRFTISSPKQVEDIQTIENLPTYRSDS